MALKMKNINDYKNLVEQGALKKHCVIEASAGTGKTYTIENIVVELLSEGIPLQSILIVTFTEKATGEMKDRIRRKIIETLENNNDDKLKEAYQNFDKASIFTIHGFCQKILNEHAFENGSLFNLEVVDDKDIFRNVFWTI